MGHFILAGVSFENLCLMVLVYSSLTLFPMLKKVTLQFYANLCCKAPSLNKRCLCIYMFK